MSALPIFAVIYSPGPRWEAGVPFHQQDGIGDHSGFLAEQYEAAVLIFGGPFLDDAGGLSVFQAESSERLGEILQTDRSITSGLLIYEVHPYALGFKPRL